MNENCNDGMNNSNIVSLRYLFPLEEEIIIKDFIDQIEIHYPGLGIPVLYGTLSILANKSVLFIGGRGTGKTRIINCVPEVEGNCVSKFDTFTLGELDSLCFTLRNNRSMPTASLGIQNMHLVFKVEDFSTLSQYHREIFLTVCSKLSSDGNYRHVTPITPNLCIENCKLTMLIAIQPKLYTKLCNQYTQWESMSYDRFTKFPVLNPLRRGKTVDAPCIATLPRKISTSATLSNNINLDNLIKLFKGQVSEGRATLYARDYAIAMARFLGKTEVEQEDIDLFIRLFSPYLESFSRLQQRQDLDSNITVSSGHLELLTEISKYLNGVNKQQLSEALMVTERHIERCVQYLLKKGLIKKDGDKYLLSDELRQFFEWYQATFSV
ncbi:MAG: hypothetical protein QXJ76_07510 [Candidatus Bathyarchaeia archaeon]